MDRRSFLKNTGWSFLGLAASGSLLGSCVSKERLIPDSMVRLHDGTIKDLLVNDGDAFH